MRDGNFHLQASNFDNTYAVGYEKIGNFVQEVTSSVDRDYDDVPEEDRKAVGSSKLRLLVGASIVNEIRKAVKDQTKYECSAGIAHNKILAKLTAGMNKPNKQTILPIDSIPTLFNDLAINKVKSMGGKLGEEVCAKLSVKTMSDLVKFSEAELQQHFQARVGSWLYWMARGIELERVTPKFMSKSIAVSKNFRGKNEISSSLTLKFWLTELAKEIVERLEKDAADCNRSSKSLIVGFTQGPENSNNNVASTRTIPLNGHSVNTYTADQIADEAFQMIKKNSTKFLKAEGTVLMHLNIKHLAITAGKFEENNPSGQPGASNSIQALLKNHKKAEPKAAAPLVPEFSSDGKSKCATLEMLKKFEMKSPKGMQRKPEEKKASSELAQSTSALEPPSEQSPAKTENLKKHSLTTPFQLMTSETFDGEFAVKGLSTLKHWTGVLIEKLCRAIHKESSENKRSPQVFILKFKQAVGSSKVKVFKNFPLSAFKDKIIDVDVIVESMKHSKSFFDVEGKIRDPIVQLELVASDYKNNESWEFTVKNTKPVPVVFLNETLSPSVAEEVVGNSDEEEETCTMKDESDEEMDVELGNYLRAELEEIDRAEQSRAGEKVEEEESYQDSSEEESDSPRYSPIFEKGDFMEDTEEVPEQTKAASPAKENVQQQPVAETSNQSGASYLQTYAEFNPDPQLLELLNPKQECPECGKMVAKLDMVSHLDHHLAFQIANDQRQEFRSQKKTSGSPLTPYQSVSKKTKKAKSKSKSSKAPVNLIEKYAVKKPPDTTNEAAEGKIKCEQCGSLIPAAEYVTHLDYHYAKKLRAENLVAKPKAEPNRKRPASAQKSQPKMKALKTYFSANNQ